MRLAITSPYMQNNNVKLLQAAMKRRGWLQGGIDGVFGPDTARAVKRGKYWLGYKTVDQVAGDLFFGIVTGTKAQTAAMKARAERRKNIAASEANRLRMIKEARNWIGTKENPAGSNRVIFSNWYGMTGPWCAMFVSYCGVKVGAPMFERGKSWAYVPYMVNAAKAGTHNLAVTYSPLEGDLVCFDWEGNGVADHIGFFDHWLSEGTTFRTVEGNTAIGNDSNGGQVMWRDRSKGNVQCFIHVGG